MCKYKARLLPLFKQQFLVFKQHYFYTLILPHMFPKKKYVISWVFGFVFVFVRLYFFFFFFQFLGTVIGIVHALCGDKVIVHALSRPTITSFKKIYIKNGPHETIYNCFQFFNKINYIQTDSRNLLTNVSIFYTII